jgi:hypothetical protein
VHFSKLSNVKPQPKYWKPPKKKSIGVLLFHLHQYGNELFSLASLPLLDELAIWHPENSNKNACETLAHLSLGAPCTSSTSVNQLALLGA